MKNEWNDNKLPKLNLLLKTALNPETQQEDAESAFIDVLVGARYYGLRLQVLPPVSSRTTDAADIVMPFGKYRGRTLEALSFEDPQYFEWLATKADIQKEQLASGVAAIWQERRGDTAGGSTSADVQALD
jgi:uncharacterized protein (DUF3820 family)